MGKGEITQLTLHNVLLDSWPCGRFYPGERWISFFSVDLACFQWKLQAFSSSQYFFIFASDTCTFTDEIQTGISGESPRNYFSFTREMKCLIL